MEPTFREVDVSRESADLTAFLCRHEWPFHRARRLGAEQVQAMRFGLPTTRSFWVDVDVDVHAEHVGLLRVQDLDDIGDGSPVFDIRI